MASPVTALLLVDLQRDYLDRPGLVPDQATLVAAVARLLDGFRAAGAPVAHVRTIVRADGSDAMPHWAGRLQCVAGTPGAEPPSLLTERPGELIAAKRHYRGFADPALDPWLRARGVTRVVIAGVYSHACVREAALDAYERGYDVIIAEDATGTDDAVHAERTRAWLEGRAARHLPAASIVRDLDTMAPGPVQHPVSTTDVCASAAMAQRAWAATPREERLALLDRWADALTERAEALADCLVEEIAKPRGAAVDEVRRAIGHIRTATDLVRSGVADDEPVDDGVVVRHRPVGVVAALMPWNNPMALPCGKIAPALAFGNAVVLKPAPEGERSAALLLDALAAAGLPAGLVGVVPGGPRAGESVIDDIHVDAVTVTGSIATGRAIATRCAVLGKPVQAELGGNNAAIVLADADLESAVPALVRNAVAYAGQRCTAIRRFVVVRDVLADFLDRAAEEYEQLRVGDPADPATEVGPVISVGAARRIEGVIADAVDAGALRVAQSHPPHRTPPRWADRFVLPILLLVDDPHARVVQEETFGPVAVVQPVDGLDEAIVVANAVEQGLVQSVVTRDRRSAAVALDRAQAGVVQWGPGIVPVHPDAPFGGWKASGLGPPEHGRWDAGFLTRPQAVYGSPWS